MKRIIKSRVMLTALAAMIALLCGVTDPAWCAGNVRIGHFPNITHLQPIIGQSLGTFDKRMAVPIDWKTFNAGPAEMEALIAGQLDIAYVGPNPAVNAFLRSKGKALRIIAGAAGGGAALVVPKDSRIASALDFKGKRVASPELGNTQDVALRYWLKSSGLTPGRDVQVIPIKNPDILMLFQQKKLDGAWVPEPWVSRLLLDGGGKIQLDERQLWPGGKFPTTVVVVRSAFYDRNRELVKRFLEAHLEVTEWIEKHPADARKRFNEQLTRLVTKPMPAGLLTEAFGRVTVTYDPLAAQLLISAGRAKDLGYLPRNADLSGGIKGMIDVSLLNEILKKKSLPLVGEK
ncbi:MAG: ABC transporter substrate-binding protein [Desulfuromonadales bacterium]